MRSGTMIKAVDGYIKVDTEYKRFCHCDCPSLQNGKCLRTSREEPEKLKFTSKHVVGASRLYFRTIACWVTKQQKKEQL